VCKCAGPFTTQQQRIQNCFNAGPQCPPLAADFTSPVKLKGLTVDPQFAIIPLASPPEVGTVGDVFTFLPKTVRPSYRWLFENNVNSITGLPNPTLPFTEASAAAIAIDGLVQSNVRQHPLLVSATDTLRDLASYWLPQKLRVEPALVGAKMLQSMSAASGHGDDCLTCGLGFSKPWYLVSPPEMQPVVFAVTEGGPRDMGNRVDADVLALFRSASGAPGRRLIAASEHASLLRKRAKPFAARFTVLDIAELTFLGAVAEDENGRMLQARGRVVGTELAMIACTDGDAISCGAQHTPMVAGVASLSALRGAIFVLRRGSGDTHARLHLFDVLNEVWQETRLVGAMLPVTPLAMTYDAHADALFVIDRAHTGGNGPARLFRIHLDGSVELVENSVGLPHKAEVFLTATEAGNLLLAATRDKNPKLGVLHLEAFGKKAKVLGRFQEKGDLLAAPFLTDRALHILRFRNGNVDALEVDPKKLGPGGGEPQVDLD
jgi:hypothetical protein